MPREYFAAICTSCGNQAQVPFKPRMDKPVYCSDCFRQIKPDWSAAARPGPVAAYAPRVSTRRRLASYALR